MITLTPQAAAQIRQAARQGQMEGMSLRLACTRKADNSLHYAMGFDDVGQGHDHTVESEGIEVVIADDSLELLRGTMIDYVELEPGQHHFIFLNPNDPNYHPPAQDHVPP